MGLFDGLRQNIEKMGPALEPEDIQIEFKPRKVPICISKLPDGIEIDINDLDSANNHGGLLGYKDAQVLLFLQNQTRHFDRIESGEFNLPKYHVAYCQTLRDMRQRGQYDRYVVTNDKTGIFRLDGSHGKTMNAELAICRNCLKHLNYRGYRTNVQAQKRIFETFNIKAFFAIYSSLFTVMPHQANQDSFDTQSTIKTDNNDLAQCSSCKAALPVRQSLLGRVVSGADPDKVVCIDCQRKININTPLPVPRAIMVDIATARRRKRPISEEMTWEEVYLYADSAYAGLLRIYQRQGWAVPEPGVDISDKDGSVCLQLGLAWFDSDGEPEEAVVLDEQEVEIARENGWHAITLNEALQEGCS